MTLTQLNRASGAAIIFVIGVVILVATTAVLKLSVAAPAIDADRGKLRAKALAEITVAEDKALNTLAVADSQRGMVHLPIASALALAAQKWPDAAAARADLAVRLDKSTVAVKPVSFE
jgi:hypothetical protein